MDCIQIKELEVYARHGVYAEENFLGQKFVVSVSIYVNTAMAVKDDSIENSVNYGEVSYFIRDWMDRNTFRLIETVADRLARDILIAFPLIEELELEVEKPNAPIAMSFRSVSVCVRRKRHRVYLGIGSNLGDRENTIHAALEKLDEREDCVVKRVSGLLETEPYGYTEQDAFLNACAEVETLQEPEAFLETLHEIEAELHRVREIHWGPRTIDLDILLYDNLILDTEKLTIPHRDMMNRQFVLEPLNEIAGWVRHPVSGKTIGEMWDSLRNRK